MSQSSLPKAVVLLSGGLDSTTTLAQARSLGFECYALSFNYSQRHSYELEAAKNVATHFQVKEHKIVNIDFISEIGNSALTDRNQKVPIFQGQNDEVPATYVPARNTIFLSLALGWAEVIAAQAIFIGVSATDYSGYPDCRPQFIEAFSQLAQLALKRTAVEGSQLDIRAPLLELNKAQTITLGNKLGVDYAMTVSCYQFDGKKACGQCDSCLFRAKGFAQAGVSDPTPYHVLPDLTLFSS